MVLNVMGSNPIGHPKKGSLSASFFASYGVRPMGSSSAKSLERSGTLAEPSDNSVPPMECMKPTLWGRLLRCYMNLWGLFL